jgi:glycosyltransferase involved in cell wall biosynthesis
MKTDTLISIIIPAYNEEKVIARTILSAREATASDNTEIIVVCNGCTDQTEQSAKDLGVRVYQSPEKGAAKASNYGAQFAKGKTLVFLDADTVIAHNLLVEVRKAVTGGCIGGRTVVRWEGSSLWSRLFSLVSYFHKYKWGGFCFVDKALFEDIGGYREGKYGFDFDLAQRVARKGKTAFIWRSHVLTSARRFEKEGWFKHILLAGKRYYVDQKLRKKGVKIDSEIEYADIR